MKHDLYILISTIDERIASLSRLLLPPSKSIYYVISHQVSKELTKESKEIIDGLTIRNDILYSSIKGKGVAKNRNNTLRFIKPSSICLILDDDVLLCENIFENIIGAFEDNPGAEFISFKILDLEENDYKMYPKKSQWHTLRTLTGIGTTEMAFRSNFILNNSMKFDERFGPGSEVYPIGEDFIFAMDLYRLKTKMLFLPIPIVKHPKGSTGDNLDAKIIFGRGAMFARVFGWKSFFIDFLFAIKKYPYYRQEVSLFRYTGSLIDGTIDYLNVHKRVRDE